MTLMTASPRFPALDLDQLAQTTDPRVRWLWHGYLAAGDITLLTSQWKAGKTTLVAMLLDRMKAGGTLAELPVAPGRAVVVSEEKPALWFAREARFQLRGHARFICQPFRGKPTQEEWLGLLDDLLAQHRAQPIDLVVIDTLASFLPGRSENDAAILMQALVPVRALANAGPAVLLVHHPRKMPAAAGHAARGSGAFGGFVDTLVEMHWYRKGGEIDRRRRLLAFSRHSATPRQLVIEQTADGAAYASLGDFEDDEFRARSQDLLAALAASQVKLTRAEVLERWPAGTLRPAAITLYRWLDQAVAQDLVRHDGTGKAHDPFRYWLPELEQQWAADPFAKLLQDHQDSLRQFDASLKPSPAPANRREKKARLVRSDPLERV
jgi:hypothetical protein